MAWKYHRIKKVQPQKPRYDFPIPLFFLRHPACIKNSKLLQLWMETIGEARQFNRDVLITLLCNIDPHFFMKKLLLSILCEVVQWIHNIGYRLRLLELISKNTSLDPELNFFNGCNWLNKIQLIIRLSKKHDNQKFRHKI